MPIVELGGRTINTDLVQSATYQPASRETFISILDRNEPIRLPGNWLSHLEKASAPVVMAQPGYTLLTIWFDENGALSETVEYPVLAWRIVCGDPVPVVMASSKADNEHRAVRFPDGRVMDWESDEDPYAGETKWRDSLRKSTR